MNNYFKPTLVVVGTFAGLLIALQLQTGPPVSGNFPVDEIEARQELIESYLDEQGYLQSRIVFYRRAIDSAEDNIHAQIGISDLKLLDRLKRHVGLSEVEGNGVEIVLNDSPLARRTNSDILDKNLVQASDIRDVVNLLNAASADAIAVNNQRVMPNSPISSVGTSILVNNVHIAPPFEIQAVGDKAIFLQRLLNGGLLPELFKKAAAGNIELSIIDKNGLTLPIYSADLQSEHLNLIE